MKLLLALLLPVAVHAQSVVDDSDIGGKAPLAHPEREGRQESAGLVFPLNAESRFRQTSGAEITGTLSLLDRDGKAFAGRLAKAKLVGPSSTDWAPLDAAGRFSFPAPSQAGSYKVRFSLDNKYWAFKNTRGRGGYEWESPAFEVSALGGQDLGVMSPAPGSDNGKLGILHLTYLEALSFLNTEASSSWWTKQLAINWPEQGDWFSPWDFSLHLSNPVAWDVVLHELGHAVMHGAMHAASAGGQHKIDECYSDALAWSEGWGTFFAAAVHLSRDDEDAKFEYLVPRRAPIRIENVPEDVCKSQASEWRVSAGLWDLYDRHPDGGDAVAFPFKTLWAGFTSGNTSSLETAWALVAKDLNPLQKQAGEKALVHNTILPAKPELTVKVAAPVGWAQPK
jgi:hypothetical protein